MKVVGFIAAGLLGIVALLALSVGLGLFGLEYDKFFKPKRAEIERNVFEQTPSFVHGKAQQISRLKLDYDLADNGAHRAGLREAILLEASTIDNTLLPADLQAFLRDL